MFECVNLDKFHLKLIYTVNYSHRNCNENTLDYQQSIELKYKH